MNETHWCEDKGTLVDYLYGELDADSRRVFEGHLRTCAACGQEMKELEAVRRELADWVPPEMALGFTVVPAHRNGGHPSASADSATILRPSRWSLSAMPAWAKVAAATFLVGAGIGLANLQVRSDANGISVSTGWLRPAASSAGRGPQAREAAAAIPGAPAWQSDLTALEADLRREIQTIRAGSADVSPALPSPASASRVSAGDPALLRRIEALIAENVAESERRQEQEFARRLAQFDRESEMQRLADLVRLEQGFGRFEAQRGAEAVRQQKMLDYLYRVSTSKVP